MDTVQSFFRLKNKIVGWQNVYFLNILYNDTIVKVKQQHENSLMALSLCICLKIYFEFTLSATLFQIIRPRTHTHTQLITPPSVSTALKYV